MHIIFVKQKETKEVREREEMIDMTFIPNDY